MSCGEAMATVAAKLNGAIGRHRASGTNNGPSPLDADDQLPQFEAKTGVVMQRALILSSLYLLVMTTLVSAYMFTF